MAPPITNPGNFTVPSFSQGWASLPSNVQTWFLWIIGVIIAVFILLAIIFLFGHGIIATIKGKSGDAAGKSHHYGDMVGVIVVVIVVFLGLGFILYLASVG